MYHAPKIDEGLYSRQLYAIGYDAMKRLASSSVLISGMNGLGVEIAKNTILQGFKTVTLHDTEPITFDDISTNYYVTENDIGKNRALASFSKLSELNNYVKVDTNTNELTENILQNYGVIVLVDYDFEKQIEINNFTHENKIHFISCSTQGLVGQVFCDFGSNFVVSDQDGEQPLTSIVENIMNDQFPLVTCIESKPHGLTNGDHVKFNNVKGMEEINEIESIEIQYVDKISFKLNIDTSKFGKYISCGEIIQVKPTKVMSFKSLKESLESPEFILTDFSDFEKPNKLHAMFRSLNNTNSFESFSRTSREYNNDISDDLLEKFYVTYDGKLVPMNSIIGGTVSQEILKACSGKFTPIYQWLYFDSLDCLSENYKQANRIRKNNRYDSQIKVFGQQLQEKLLNMKYFIVGSGAIGCELLKNYAMIGLGCGDNGKIYITDMDTIEKSNLNRQFLFRNTDIGKSKAEVASRAIKMMNPDVNIEAHLNRVGPETENVYDINFFNSLDGVSNALDNVQARLYVDRRCVTFKKSLLESGTLGTKANVQVIVPSLTESYGSSRDPPEASVPVCTIKTFPNEIEHVIQWSREQFEDLLVQKPKYALEYFQGKDKNQLLQMPASDALTVVDGVKYVLNNMPKSFDDCIKFAYNQWYEYYNFQIDQLLYKFPSDSVTSTGSLFWSGAKKCPHVIDFDLNNVNHLGYIVALSNLWAHVFGMSYNKDMEYIKRILHKFIPPKSVINKDIKISVNDEEEKKRIEESTKLIDVSELIMSLPDHNTLQLTNIIPHEFEKDDDSNFHIDFITASSNMRALNYDIKIADRHTIKGIAGKIIPALATTTSIVAGLVTLELYKLAQNFNKIEQYRNYFVNLALPYFGFSEPVKTPLTKIANKEYTMWDTFIIEKDITLEEFIDLFKTKYDLELDAISYGNFMIYGLMLNPRKRVQRMGMRIKEIIESELDRKLSGSSITLQICNTIDDDENANDDAELPEVIFML
jgi:ubiquitin-activating enzyme E1